MASPFPGMDPFIEACKLWEDFHSGMIQEIQRAIDDRLPERYAARTGERSYVVLRDDEAEEDRRHQMIVDVSVVSRRKEGGRSAATAAVGQTAVLEAPHELTALISEEFRETFINIIAFWPERRLVTVIELLSPSNKRMGSDGWQIYNRQRAAVLQGDTSLVEIDLLRGGTRMPMRGSWPDSPYCLLVCRRDEAPKCGAWPASSDVPLPTIPIPLLPPDADILLELQPLVDEIFRRSRYEQDIDYAVDSPELLTKEETAILETARNTTLSQ